MTALALLYHDVVAGTAYGTSGFPGGPATTYKLPAALFDDHLGAIAGSGARVTVAAKAGWSPGRELECLLTFDDGGASALTNIAPALEARGWRGHFFITTDYIGARGFLDASGIAELHRRGHAIGSHSCSHPLRFADQPRAAMIDEWRRSIDALEAILHQPVETASVPGGQYTRQVGAAAAAAGLKILFTSEPTTHRHMVDGCLILGRFSIKQSTAADAAGRLAAGHVPTRVRQWVGWNVKKAAKAVGGRHYLRLRDALLRPAEPRHD